MTNENDLENLNKKLNELSEKDNKIKQTITELEYSKSITEKELKALGAMLSQKYNVESYKGLKQIYEQLYNEVLDKIKEVEKNQTASSEIIQKIKSDLENLENEK